MNYAQTYHIGYNPNTRSKTAKTTPQAASRVRKLDETAQRCKRDPKGQTEVCSPEWAPNALLKVQFMPKLATGGTIKSLEEIEVLEKEFYKSLCRLADHYGRFELTDTRLFGYPYNIAYSIWEAENFLKKKVRNWESLRLIQDKKKIFLISEERYSTGSTLYYIPVIPLFLMLRDRSKKKTAQLLVSVCAYLYHIADIPYYKQEDTYLYWQYEMLSEWVEQDDETEETEVYKKNSGEQNGLVKEWSKNYSAVKIWRYLMIV
jgi:hypothetical protein